MSLRPSPSPPATRHVAEGLVPFAGTGEGPPGAGNGDRAEPSHSPPPPLLEEPGGVGDPPHSLGDTSEKHLFLALVTPK